MNGPVQVLVVGFEQPSFTGEVLAEFERLQEAGVVRLVDLLLVSRSQDGTIETLTADLGDPDADLGGVAAALLGRPREEAAVAPDDGEQPPAGDEAQDAEAATWSLADAVPPGSAAAVALIEHLWAGPLVEAIRRAGGEPLDETWLAPDDLETLAALIEARRSSG